MSIRCSSLSRLRTKTSTRRTSASGCVDFTRDSKRGPGTGRAMRRRSEQRAPTVDRQHLARDPRGPRRDEEAHAVRDVFGTPEAPQGDPFDEPPLTFLAVAFPLLFGRRIGPHETGSDAVHGDAERSELVRHLTREPDLTRLGACICLDAREADAAPGAG